MAELWSLDGLGRLMPHTSTLKPMSRPIKVALVVVFAIVVAIFGLTMHEIYVPGQTREVFGSVVSLQSDLLVRHSKHYFLAS